MRRNIGKYILVLGLCLSAMILWAEPVGAQAPYRQRDAMPGAAQSGPAPASAALQSPRMAVKTNLLYGATATPNLGFEIVLDNRMTLDLTGGYNWFDWKDNKKWKHWIVQPGLRWWICEPFNGAFAGVHLHGGEFNVGGVGPFTTIKNNRYDGWFAGAGISAGYQWILSNRFSFEVEFGLGYAHMRYTKFGCAECAPKIGSGHYNYFGPTKAAVTFLYNLW